MFIIWKTGRQSSKVGGLPCLTEIYGSKNLSSKASSALISLGCLYRNVLLGNTTVKFTKNGSNEEIIRAWQYNVFQFPHTIPFSFHFLFYYIFFKYRFVPTLTKLYRSQSVTNTGPVGYSMAASLEINQWITDLLLTTIYN